MGGIEPPSTAGEPRFLRAQPAFFVLLGPDPYHRRTAIDGPSPGISPTVPQDRAAAASPLADVGDRSGGASGPTASLWLTQRERTRCETYWHLLFARSVYEITLHPRPAFRRRTGNVETDHPHDGARPLSRCGVVTPSLGLIECKAERPQD